MEPNRVQQIIKQRTQAINVWRWRWNKIPSKSRELPPRTLEFEGFAQEGLQKSQKNKGLQQVTKTSPKYPQMDLKSIKKSAQMESKQHIKQMCQKVSKMSAPGSQNADQNPLKIVTKKPLSRSGGPLAPFDLKKLSQIPPI